MVARNDLLTDRDPTRAGEEDVIGYRVEAIDGHTGKVDEATNDVDISYIVVDTGWIFGKKVMVPAAVINSIDHDQETLRANPTKGQIKASPEFNVDAYDDDYQNEVDTYYGPGGLGSQDW